MKKTLLIGILGFSALLYGYEPSAYGAGNMDSEEPYGLTTTERGVLENRRAVQNLKNRVGEQQNRIDGLTTIIEGLNNQIVELKEQLRDAQNASATAKNQENSQTYNMLLEMGQILDKINNSYVTQEELKTALGSGGGSSQSFTQAESSVYTSSAISSSPSSTTNNNNSATTDMPTLYRRAVQLFGQKSYQSAKENFEKTASNGYKSASSNYYLGEIAYYTHDYTNAVGYYKKSSSLYDHASYMKILYLHTAISLDRSGQKSQAKGFFEYVIDNYPETKAAEIAKKNL